MSHIFKLLFYSGLWGEFLWLMSDIGQSLFVSGQRGIKNYSCGFSSRSPLIWAKSLMFLVIKVFL